MNRGVIAVLLAVAALVGVALFMPGGRPDFDRSPTGYDGLPRWLVAGGLDARKLTPGQVAASDPLEIGLLVLPILDSDLDSDMPPPRTADDIKLSASEEDQYSGGIARKVAQVPTLLVLPKWRRGARLTGYAHASLLIGEDDVLRPLEQVGHRGFRLVRPSLGDGFSIDDSGLTLYAPQVFAEPLPEGCRSILSALGGALAAACTQGDRTARILSDPDLINNHGLSLGGNAALARAFLGDLAGTGRIVIDRSNHPLWFDTPDTHRPRGWSEFARLFRFPYAWIWLAGAAATALLLWRGAVRDAPPLPEREDRQGANTAAALEAKARLLRLSGDNARLLEAHVTARMRDLERDLTGREGNAGSHLTRLERIISRRDIPLGQQFRSAAHAAFAVRAHAGEAELQDRLAAFEDVLGRVRHEFGRT